MKKILIPVLIMIVALGIGIGFGLSSSPKNEVELEYIEGLNGQREYYELETEEVNGVVAGSEIDTTNAPQYILDENGDYIEFCD